MSVKKGQIIYHNFPLPNKEESELHPVLILSNETVSSECEMYVGLMITSSEYYRYDYFTYELDDNMFVKNKLPKDNKFLRLHLIAYFQCKLVKSDIIAEINEKYLPIILDQQRSRVFDDE